MRNIFAAFALTTFALATAASAADNPLAPAFGNTLVVKSADGEITKLRLKEDGTYTGEGPAGDAFTGTWSLKSNNTKFCWKNNEPPKGKPNRPPVGCAPLTPATKEAGTPWKQKDFDEKQEISIEIVPGT
jgi:hypothetical protein